MKYAMVITICVMCLGVSAQEAQPKLSGLNWMAGCWEQKGKTEGSFLSERWTKPLGMMIGTNRNVKGNVVKSYEFLRIEERSDGIFYIAKPASADKETGFKLILLENEKVVFENKMHDFPKRVIYMKSGDNVLEARVEDDSRGLGFRFEKAACD